MAKPLMSNDRLFENKFVDKQLENPCTMTDNKRHLLSNLETDNKIFISIYNLHDQRKPDVRLNHSFDA